MNEREAFKILDTDKYGIPYTAIEFLRKQRSSTGIEQKIIFALTHAYDDTYYSEKEEFYYPTPLWYGIVAETHLSQALTDTLVGLFTTTTDDWDILNEEGQYLVGLLAQKWPDEVMKKVMAAVDKMLLEKKKDYPYLYLFDAFYFVDKKKYTPWFLKTLADGRLGWIGMFASDLADLGLAEALPILKYLLKQKARNLQQIDKNDIRDAIEILESGKNPYEDESKPYVLTRRDWKSFLKSRQDLFEPEKNEKKEKTLDEKLHDMLDDLKLSERITPDDIRNVIYHERTGKEIFELVGGFTKYVSSLKKMNTITALLQETWNTTPHKSRDNFSPEMLVAMNKQKGKKGMWLPNDWPPKYHSKKTTVADLFSEDYSEKLALVNGRGDEWYFDLPLSYKKSEEALYTLLEEDIPPGMLKKELEHLIFQDGHAMGAIQKLATLLWEEGEDEKSLKVLGAGIHMAEEVFPQGFDRTKHHLPWGFHENRPYLTLLLDQAMTIEIIEGVGKSIPYYEDILQLNPNDNQGVRGILATLYLKTNRLHELVILRSHYPDDITQELALGNVLALYKLGKFEEAIKELKSIYEYTKHSIKELLKTDHVKPREYRDDRITMGGPDEAYHYYEAQGFLWQGAKGAIDFLHLFRSKPKEKKK